jgi:hypothetical protein
MKAILNGELLDLSYKSMYDSLSLFNIISIVIERNVKSTNYIMLEQFPIMKKHEHLIDKRLDNTIDLTE